MHRPSKIATLRPGLRRTEGGSDSSGGPNRAIAAAAMSVAVSHPGELGGVAVQVVQRWQSEPRNLALGRRDPRQRRSRTRRSRTGHDALGLRCRTEPSAVLAHQRGVAVQVHGPAFRPVYAVGHCFPSRPVPVQVPVLQLDPRASRRLRVKPHLDLTGARTHARSALPPLPACGPSLRRSGSSPLLGRRFRGLGVPGQRPLPVGVELITQRCQRGSSDARTPPTGSPAARPPAARQPEPVGQARHDG